MDTIIPAESRQYPLAADNYGRQAEKRRIDNRILILS
jgi:hypothetical protein